SGVNSTVSTLPECPISVKTSLPVSICHNLIVRSLLPDASILELGETAKAVTAFPLCPGKTLLTVFCAALLGTTKTRATKMGKQQLRFMMSLFGQGTLLAWSDFAGQR